MVREYLECNNIYTSVDGSLLRIFLFSLEVNAICRVRHAHLPSQALIPLIPENELDCILVAGLPRPRKLSVYAAPRGFSQNQRFLDLIRRSPKLMRDVSMHPPLRMSRAFSIRSRELFFHLNDLARPRPFRGEVEQKEEMSAAPPIVGKGIASNVTIQNPY
jgi:hypothetical protein